MLLRITIAGQLEVVELSRGTVIENHTTFCRILFASSERYQTSTSYANVISQLSEVITGTNNDNRQVCIIPTAGTRVRNRKDGGSRVSISRGLTGNSYYDIKETVSQLSWCACEDGGGGGAVVVKKITAADFTGNNITGQGIPALLTGLEADTDFFFYSDEGSGTLLREGDGYTFDSGTGEITASIGNYRLKID